METRLEKISNTLKNWVIGKYELFNFIVLNILLLLACFLQPFIILAFLWTIIICALNKDISCIFGYFLYTKMFRNVLIMAEINLQSLLSIIICVIIIVKAFISLFKDKIIINKKYIIIFIIFSIYLSIIPMPIHNNSTSIFDILITMLTLFAAFVLKDKIDFAKIVKYFAYAVVISSFMTLLKDIFPCTIFAYYKIDFSNDITRFSGLLFHPNNFLAFSTISMATLLILLYQNQIKNYEFFALYFTEFIFSLMCISRMFLVYLAATLVSFVILYLIKYKKKSLINIGILVLGLIALSLIFKTYLDCLIFRVQNPYETRAAGTINALSAEQFNKIMNGEVAYDPGRIGLWRLYLTKIFSSPFRFFFGFGVDEPQIGQLHPHCSAIYFLYQFGFIGYILLFTFVASMINFKKAKNWKAYIEIIILILGFYSIALLNCNAAGIVPYIITIIFFNNQRFEIKKD